MTTEAPRKALSSRRIKAIAFASVIGLTAAAVFVVSLDFPRSARLFPQTVSAALVVLALCSIAVNVLRGQREDRTNEEKEEIDTTDLTSDSTISEVMPYLIWIGGTYLAIYLIGFFPASALFCVLFLKRIAHMRWLTNIAMTAFCLGTVLVLGIALNISWPEGILPPLLPF